MENKTKYEAVELDVLFFESDDIITNSTDTDDEPIGGNNG